MKCTPEKRQNRRRERDASGGVPLCRRRHRRSAVTPYSTRGDFDLRDIPNSNAADQISSRAVSTRVRPMIRGSTSECHRSSVRPRNILCAVSEGKRSRGRSSAHPSARRPGRRSGMATPDRDDAIEEPLLSPGFTCRVERASGGDAGAPPSPAFRILTRRSPRNRPPSPPSLIGSSAGARPPSSRQASSRVPDGHDDARRTSRREQTPLVRSCVLVRAPRLLPPVPSLSSQPPSPRDGCHTDRPLSSRHAVLLPRTGSLARPDARWLFLGLLSRPRPPSPSTSPPLTSSRSWGRRRPRGHSPAAVRAAMLHRGGRGQRRTGPERLFLHRAEQTRPPSPRAVLFARMLATKWLFTSTPSGASSGPTHLRLPTLVSRASLARRLLQRRRSRRPRPRHSRVPLRPKSRTGRRAPSSPRRVRQPTRWWMTAIARRRAKRAVRRQHARRATPGERPRRRLLRVRNPRDARVPDGVAPKLIACGNRQAVVFGAYKGGRKPGVLHLSRRAAGHRALLGVRFVVDASRTMAPERLVAFMLYQSQLQDCAGNLLDRARASQERGGGDGGVHE